MFAMNWVLTEEQAAQQLCAVASALTFSAFAAIR
jgi:hypothetical protein